MLILFFYLTTIYFACIIPMLKVYVWFSATALEYIFFIKTRFVWKELLSIKLATLIIRKITIVNQQPTRYQRSLCHYQKGHILSHKTWIRFRVSWRYTLLLLIHIKTYITKVYCVTRNRDKGKAIQLLFAFFLLNCSDILPLSCRS